MAPPNGFPFPYIMDPDAIEGKIAHILKLDLPTPILKAIIIEMSKGYRHIFETMGNCSRNVDLIIEGEEPFPYPIFDPPIEPKKNK